MADPNLTDLLQLMDPPVNGEAVVRQRARKRRNRRNAFSAFWAALPLLTIPVVANLAGPSGLSVASRAGTTSAAEAGPNAGGVPNLDVNENTFFGVGSSSASSTWLVVVAVLVLLGLLLAVGSVLAWRRNRRRHIEPVIPSSRVGLAMAALSTLCFSLSLGILLGVA